MEGLEVLKSCYEWLIVNGFFSAGTFLLGVGIVLLHKTNELEGIKIIGFLFSGILCILFSLILYHLFKTYKGGED